MYLMKDGKRVIITNAMNEGKIYEIKSFRMPKHEELI